MSDSNALEVVDSATAQDCEGCGYEVDSFACKIRHLQINTGCAKAANDDGF